MRRGRQTGIKIVGPVMGTSDGNPEVINSKPADVFDVSPTRSLKRVAAVAAERQPRPRV